MSEQEENMFRVYVTRRIPEAGLKLLRTECEVEVNPHDRPLSARELSQKIKGRDGLLFATARRVVEADTCIRSGSWEGWGPLQFLGGDITGATLGVIGSGRIGTAVALKSRGFAMHDARRASPQCLNPEVYEKN